MKQYTSQLKGWSFDRAVEAHKLADDKPTVETILHTAKTLSEYAYEVEEDAASTAKNLFELLSQLPDNEDTAGLVAMLLHGLNKMQSELTSKPVEVV